MQWAGLCQRENSMGEDHNHCLPDAWKHSLTQTLRYTCKESTSCLDSKNMNLFVRPCGHSFTGFGLFAGIVKLTQSDKQLATRQHAHANTHSEFVTSATKWDCFALAQTTRFCSYWLTVHTMKPQTQTNPIKHWMHQQIWFVIELPFTLFLWQTAVSRDFSSRDYNVPTIKALHIIHIFAHSLSTARVNTMFQRHSF